jgi:hypothetical protein
MKTKHRMLKLHIATLSGIAVGAFTLASRSAPNRIFGLNLVSYGQQRSHEIAGGAESRPWRTSASERVAALPAVRAHAVCFL